MKAFITPAKFRARITKTTPRKEPHGPDLVQAISLRMKWDTTNDSLTLLHPRLKDMLFYREPQVDAQEKLDGLPEVTPNLRVPIAGLPLGIEASFTGYTLNIEHGIDDATALELYVCTLDKFKVDAKEGGTAVIEWSLASNKKVTHELVGELCGLEGCEIVCTLTPPAIAQGETIDGTKAAFDADHPDQASLLDGDAAPMDATDAFVDQHAGDFGSDELDDASDAEGLDMHGDEDATDESNMPAPKSRRTAPKYRDPLSGQTWTGRGLKPKWLVAKLNEGRPISEFEL